MGRLWRTDPIAILVHHAVPLREGASMGRLLAMAVQRSLDVSLWVVLVRQLAQPRVRKSGADGI